MTVGRKTKLTKPLIRKLSKALARYPAKYAAPLAGISERSLYAWRKEGQAVIESIESGDLDSSAISDHQELLIQFMQTLEVSKAELVRKYFDAASDIATGWEDKITKKIVKGDIKAVIFLLSKLDPDLFGDSCHQESKSSSDNESLPPVLETPGFANCDDPESQFLQVCAAQQKATKNFAAQKQREEQGE